MKWPLAKFEEVALPGKGAIVSGPFGSNIGSRFFVDEGVPVSKIFDHQEPLTAKAPIIEKLLTSLELTAKIYVLYLRGFLKRRSMS